MKKRKKLVKELFLVVIILIVVLVVLVLVDFNFFDSFKSLFKKPELITIKDSCGVYLGSIIHQVKSEDNCQIMCQNECGLRKESFVRVEFTQENNSCNECNCYCK